MNNSEGYRAAAIARFSRTQDPQDATPPEWYECALQGDECEGNGYAQCSCGDIVCEACGDETNRGFRCLICLNRPKKERAA